MLAVATTAIAGSATTAAVLWLTVRWRKSRRRQRRRAEAVCRLEAAMGNWYCAARSYESDATASAFQLRSYGQAALDCAQALATLERGDGLVNEWYGPPFKPTALARADRPGPADCWNRFDRAFDGAWSLMRPFENCLALGQAAIALADWIEKNRPLTRAPEPQDVPNERAGAEAAFVHAVSSPCLAELAAESVLQQDGPLQIDITSLEQLVEETGSDRQRTMMSLADALVGRPHGGPTIGELLTLENTDLCHALEAVALARELRRVYPPQRPELLWMRAALAESDGDQEPGPTDKPFGEARPPERRAGDDE